MDVSIGFYSVARPRSLGVCHSGASCSWRADNMVRSWKSTDQSENGLAGSDNWISGFQDFKTLAQFQSGRSLLRGAAVCRSEEHTSELQSRLHLVCRLLLG